MYHVVMCSALLYYAMYSDVPYCYAFSVALLCDVFRCTMLLCIHRCHVLFNAKLMNGAGCTFGDVIEQMWSHLRPHSGASTYMADNHREIFLEFVVGIRL